MRRFWQTLYPHLFELVKLNLLFALFCLPVVSIPAAVTAMTRINLHIINGEPYSLWEDFFTVFRDEFFSSLKLGAALLLCGLLFYYVFWFYQSASSTSVVLMGLLRTLTLLPLLIVYLASCYQWVMLSAVSLKTVAIIKNSVLLSVVCVRQTLVCLITGVIFALVGVSSLPYSTPFLLVGGLALWNFICTYAVYPQIKRLIIEKPSSPPRAQDDDAPPDSQA